MQYKKSSDLYKRLFVYVKPFWPILLLGIGSNVLYTGVDAGFTYLIKPFMDKSFVEPDNEFIRMIPWIVLIAIVIRGISSGLGSYCMTWVARKVVMRLRQHVFKHILYLPIAYYDKSPTGKLLSKILYDVEQVAQVSADALTTLVQSVFMVIGLILVMFVRSWQLSLLFLLTSPVIAAIVYYSNRKTRKVSHDAQQTMGKVTEIASEAIDGVQVVRIFGGQQVEEQRFNQATEHSRRRDMKVAKIKFLNIIGVQLVIGIGISAIISMAIYLSASVNVGAGGFVSMLVAMLLLIKPMKDLSTVNSTIQRGLAGAESVFNLFEQPLESEVGQEITKQLQGQIQFKQVSFSYDQTHHVFRHLNLDIPSGTTVALVGRSGSGKTTLAHLIPRFYEIDEGKILFDGEDIREMTMASVRNQIGLVSQDVILFNDTVAANIAYGCDNIDMDKVIKTAKQSYAYDFIMRLPEGFNTLVGENGLLLSGGQRQRLAIARALYKDAPILILDEATSALDNESERYIQKALEDMHQSRTIVIIAHRLTTIEQADTIVVLEDGRIIEQGDHNHLLAKGGSYARLYNSQLQQSEKVIA